jgi:hypothetical protein
MLVSRTRVVMLAGISVGCVLGGLFFLAKLSQSAIIGLSSLTCPAAVDRLQWRGGGTLATSRSTTIADQFSRLGLTIM